MRLFNYLTLDRGGGVIAKQSIPEGNTPYNSPPWETVGKHHKAHKGHKAEINIFN
jgi:hypothetical protein